MRASRPDRRLPRIAALSLAFACAAAAAAPDDLNAPAPEAVPDAASRVAAFGRRVLETVLASERSVVDAISAGIGSAAPAPGWRAGTGPSALGARPATLAARAAAGADAAADPMQRPGLSELSLGAKWHVLQGDPATHVPCVSWMADVQPVSAASFFDGGSLRPSVHLSAEWALTEDLSLGVMPGVALGVDRQGRRFANGTLAVTLGKEWAPGVRTFVDVARDRLTMEQGGGVSSTFDAGVTLVTGPATQVDFAVARGLTPAAPPFQAGVGVSSAF